MERSYLLLEKKIPFKNDHNNCFLKLRKHFEAMQGIVAIPFNKEICAKHPIPSIKLTIPSNKETCAKRSSSNH